MRTHPIKTARVAKGWSQKDLAARLGMKNARSVGAWEAKVSYPKREVALKLCELLGLKLEEVLG